MNLLTEYSIALDPDESNYFSGNIQSLLQSDVGKFCNFTRSSGLFIAHISIVHLLRDTP